VCVGCSSFYDLVGGTSGRSAHGESDAVGEQSREVLPEGVVWDQGDAVASLDELVVEHAADEVDDGADDEDDEADPATRERRLDQHGTAGGVLHVEDDVRVAQLPRHGNHGCTGHLLVAEHVDRGREGLAQISRISIRILKRHTAIVRGNDGSLERTRASSRVLTHAVRTKDRAGRSRIQNHRERHAHSRIVLHRRQTRRRWRQITRAIRLIVVIEAMTGIQGGANGEGKVERRLLKNGRHTKATTEHVTTKGVRCSQTQ